MIYNTIGLYKNVVCIRMLKLTQFCSSVLIFPATHLSFILLEITFFVNVLQISVLDVFIYFTGMIVSDKLMTVVTMNFTHLTSFKKFARVFKQTKSIQAVFVFGCCLELKHKRNPKSHTINIVGIRIQFKIRRSNTFYHRFKSSVTSQQDFIYDIFECQ